uniref:Uncharacterized protein n=1 Tax=viral metagenome TaxID=1070528 RepID=A0A6H1ZRS0_9ZZZZ
MKAKDTVQHYSKTVGCPRCDYEFEINDTVDDLNLEQAGISFKLGYEEGRLYGKQESLFNQAIIDQWVKDSRQEGIRAVVNWGLETCPHDLFGEGTQCYKRACDMCWAEQIKLWEVEDA